MSDEILLRMFGPDTTTGIIQCILLTGIWINGLGMGKRVANHETRITKLEQGGKHELSATT